ncbi:MAG: MBL fold metallo-hydrolase [Sphingorhabdus sp.]|uniref:MBL fold metallo-hydrolase n=1 Tax=Sphingorhabdus sp. TaxID=1902408 RepID=UPI003CA9E526
MSALPIAGHWFERKALGDGITLLWEPHVHPLLRCNIWHVAGRDSDLLVDTGLGVARLAEAARDLFDKPLTVVLTHCHMDHAGGAHEFDTCCVHPAEAAALAEASNHLPLDVSVYSADDLAWFAGIGYDISGGLLAAIPHAGFNPVTHVMQAAQASRLIGEGDVVDLGDRKFEVLHLPGHSPGSIALWDAASGTLFSGDAIYDGALLDQIPGSDIPAYILSMERLRDLPVRVVHAGHDPSFGRDRLVELANAYLTSRSNP